MSFKETEVGRIPIDWEVDELSNKVDLVMGQSPKSEFYNDKGIGMPFMQWRTTFGEKYHYINTWCTDIKRVGIKNSVLMSVRAPVGDVNIATEDICIGRGLASLNMKNKNNEFLYYLLKNYSGLLISKESGTVFGSINKAGIEKLVLPFPSNSEQKAIAKILSDLDEKIEVNNKINKNLEEMAQAIFKQWFVDFEFPNEEGKPYKSSGGEMVESELGMIPKGWKISKIGEVVKIIRGASPRPIQNYLASKGIPWLKISDATSSASRYIYSTKEFIIEEGISKSRKVEKGTLVLSNSATPGIAKIMDIEACVHDGWLIFNEYKNINKEYIYYYLSREREKILLMSNGSVFRNLKTDILKNYPIIIPNSKILDYITETFTIIGENINKNSFEIETLNKLRDTLLPKLMSGEIRVPLEYSEN
ncbi:restriction endonuclease subunit S [Clostridium perfringens]|uniref:restriction endonuclease subunit S n=1 Tax=Clostridium perfringens TaxID=1502 RepID=UPI0024BD0134|nr:restriction endonuclease subunit S [Clostridium perfringens]